MTSQQQPQQNANGIDISNSIPTLQTLRERVALKMQDAQFDPNENILLANYMQTIVQFDDLAANVFDLPWSGGCINAFIRKEQSLFLILRYFELLVHSKVCIISNNDYLANELKEKYLKLHPDSSDIQFIDYHHFFQHWNDFTVIFVNDPDSIVLLEWVKALFHGSIYIINNKYTDSFDYVCKTQAAKQITLQSDTVLNGILSQILYYSKDDKMHGNIVVYANKRRLNKLFAGLCKQSSSFPIIPETMKATDNQFTFNDRLKSYISANKWKHYFLPIIMDENSRAAVFVNFLPESISAIILARNAASVVSINRFINVIDTNMTSITPDKDFFEGSVITESEKESRQVFPTTFNQNIYCNIQCPEMSKGYIPLELPEIQHDRLISFMNGENQISLMADLLQNNSLMLSLINDYSSNPNMCIFTNLLFFIIEMFSNVSLKINQIPEQLFDETSDLITIFNVVKHDIIYDSVKKYLDPRNVTYIKSYLCLFCMIGKTDIQNFLQFMEAIDMKTVVNEVISNFLNINPEFVDSHTLKFDSLDNDIIWYKAGKKRYQLKRTEMPYLALSKTCISFSIKKSLQIAKIIHCTSPMLFETLTSETDIKNPFFSLLTKIMIDDCISYKGRISIETTNSNKKQEIQNAIELIKRILPFFPRSVLIRNMDIGFYYEIVNIGADNCYTRVYTDRFPHAYAITKELIIWAASQYDELAKVEPNIRFAITSDKFAHGSAIPDSPTLANRSIFGDGDYSIFLLSIDPIDNVPTQTLLWVKISVESFRFETINRVSPRNIFAKMIPVIAIAPSTSILINNSKISKSTLAEVINYIRNHPENAQTYTFQPANNMNPSTILRNLSAKNSIDGLIAVSRSGLITFTRCDEMGEKELRNKCINARIYQSSSGYYSYRGEAVSLKITHFEYQGMDSSLFTLKIQKTLESFGNLVLYISSYRASTNPGSLGFIRTLILTDTIAFNIANKLKEALHLQNFTPLSLPEIPRSFFYYPPTQSIIEKWINDNQSIDTITTNEKYDWFESTTVYSIIVANCSFLSTNANTKLAQLLGNNYFLIKPSIFQDIQIMHKIDDPPLATIKDFPNCKGDYYEINNYSAVVEFPKDFNPDPLKCENYKIYPGQATHIHIELKTAVSSFSKLLDKLRKAVGYHKVLQKIKNNSVDLLFLAKYDIKEVTKIIRQFIPSYNPVSRRNFDNTQTIRKVIKCNHSYLATTEEADRFRAILNGNPINFGYVTVSLNGRVTSKMKLSTEWHYNYYTRDLIVPQGDKEKAEQFKESLPLRNASSDEYIFCLDNCDPKAPTRTQLTIYNQDGTTQTNFMCLPCLLELFQYNVGANIEDPSLMVSASKRPLYLAYITSKVDTNTMSSWPQVPLGELIWQLLSVPQLNPFVQAWISTMMYLEINTLKSTFTFCPDHPQTIFLNENKMIKCKEPRCEYYLCDVCHNWHTPNRECSPWTGHRCPRCHAPSIKNGGCNHMSCTCGCHWCYACPIGQEFHADRSALVYGHMNSVHGGYYTT